MNSRKQKGKMEMIIVKRIVFFGLGLLIMNACSQKLTPADTEKPVVSGFDTADYNIIFNDALKNKMNGNPGNAIRLFERAIKINKNSDASYYELSQLYQSAGDQQKAVSYAARAAILDPLNNWYINNAGLQYYYARKYDSAVYYYENLIKLEPDREDLRLSLAGFYEDAKQYAKAEEILKEFIVQYGEEDELLIGLIRIYGNWGKEDLAEKMILKLIESSPDKLKSYNILAEFYKFENRDEEALAIYEKLYEMAPDNPFLQLSYVDFLRSAGKYDEFLSELSKLILNDDIEVNGLVNVFASVLNDSKLIEERGHELELPTMLLISSYPDIPEIILLASQIFEACGKDERAVGTLRNYSQKHPENYPMWERLLFAYSSRTMIDDLYTTSKYVATKFNLSPIPKLLLAFASNERGEYDLAIGELDKAYTLAGNNRELIIEITSLLASVYYKQGDTERAFNTFDKGLELSPDNAAMLNNYAYYLSEENIRLKEALSMIEDCLKIESNSTYLDTYAWILYKLGKYRKANDIMSGLSLNGTMETADHYEHYGFIKKAMGECTKAIEMWDKAVEMDLNRDYLLKEIEKCQSGK